MKVVLIFNALLTPLIAIVTTYIAVQQWKSNQLKLRMDRYDRRLQIYKDVLKFLKAMGVSARPRMEDALAFYGATAEADFLFGPEISDFIQEAMTRAFPLCRANMEQSNVREPLARDEVTEEMKWFVGQVYIAKKIFKKYLDINK
jgi:hypothetical protein